MISNTGMASIILLAGVVIVQASDSNVDSITATCVGACTGAPLAANTCCLDSAGTNQCNIENVVANGVSVFGGDRRLAEPLVVTGDMHVCDGLQHADSAAEAPPAQSSTDVSDGEGPSITATCVGACTGAPLAANTCCLDSAGKNKCNIENVVANGVSVFGGARRLAQPLVVTGDMHVCDGLQHADSVAEAPASNSTGASAGDGISKSKNCVGACTDAPLAEDTCCLDSVGRNQCNLASYGHIVFSGDTEKISSHIQFCATEAPAPSALYIAPQSSFTDDFLSRFGRTAAVSFSLVLLVGICFGVVCAVRRRSADALLPEDDDLEMSSASEQ